MEDKQKQSKWYENKKVYVKKFDAETYKKYLVRINTKTETDIIEHLEKQTNKQGYIKALIRKDMSE